MYVLLYAPLNAGMCKIRNQAHSFILESYVGPLQDGDVILVNTWQGLVLFINLRHSRCPFMVNSFHGKFQCRLLNIFLRLVVGTNGCKNSLKSIVARKRERVPRLHVQCS